MRPWRNLAVAGRITATAAVVLGVALRGSAAIGAGPIVETNGFDLYADGPLQGQQGWVSPAGTTSATVQSTVAKSGKAIAVERQSNSDRRWAVPKAGFPTQRFVVIEWDMQVWATGSATAFGPFFGVDAYDDHGVFGLLGSLGVDATTGDVLYQVQDSGALMETDAVAEFDVWNHFQMVLDFDLNQYSVFFNDVNLKTTGFVDRGDDHNDLDEFTDADIAAFAAGGDNASKTQIGSAFFDNFVVWDGVPGDVDVDGVVDAADLTAWKGAFGPSAAANLDGDGDSDGSDFLIWQRSLGRDVVSASAVATAVPEPSVLALAFAALGASLFARRQARRWE